MLENIDRAQNRASENRLAATGSTLGLTAPKATRRDGAAISGIKRMAVVTPGFSADCLETIEEIGSESAECFFAAGGEAFALIDCLNDSNGGMRVIESVVRRELRG